MTLQEWKAQLGMGRGAAPSTPASAAPEDTGLVDTPMGEMRAATLGDDPTSAVEGELLRTATEAGKGLLRSPLDLANGLLHPLDTLMGIASAVRHPIDAVTNLAKHPKEAGSALGQMLLAPKLLGAAETALTEGPGMVGRGMSAVGRGAEVAGQTGAKVMRRGIVPMITAATNHPLTAAAELLVPPALEYGGRAMQRGGAALEGLDLAAQGRKLKTAVTSRFGVDAPPVDSAADTVRETVKTARDYQDAGASHAQAGARAGWPLGKSGEASYQAESATPNPDLFPYQSEELANGRSARRIDALGKKIGENSWAGDVSAKPDSVTGLEAAVQPASPIEQFYRTDPQARVGGEGRMTGQFDEGSGGLTDAAAGNLDTYVSPKTLAQLSEMSGRALSPADAQAILNQYRSVRVQE